MKTACLLLLVVPAATENRTIEYKCGFSLQMCTKQYKVVTSGRCSEPPMSGAILDRNNYWIETKAACEAAASALGKKQTTIPANQVDENFYPIDPPYCAYYPDATLADSGSNGPDALWFHWRENTGVCAPNRECICVVYEASDDSASALFGGDALSTTVVVVIAAALLGYFCWQYLRRPRR